VIERINKNYMPKIKHAYNVTIKIGSEAVMDDREQQQIEDRRKFLISAGRFAAVTPPALPLLLSTSLTSDAIAHSGIGRKGGDKPGNNGWGNGGNDGGDKGGEYR
jgi:hypothetical protein